MMLGCLLLFFMNWEASSSYVPLSSLIHHQIQDDTYLYKLMMTSFILFLPLMESSLM